MKKRLLVILLCLSMLITAVGALNTSSETYLTSDLEFIGQELPGVLYNIEINAELFGFESVDFENLSISNKLSTYRTTDDGLEEVDFVEYALMDGDEYVAIVTIIYLENNEKILQIGKSFAEELNGYNDLDFVIIYDNNSINLYNEYGEINILETYYDIESINNLTLDEALANISDIELEFCRVSSVTDAEVAQAPFTRTVYTKTLSVPGVTQGNYGLCWAACVASFGNYKNGNSYTAKNVADIVNIGYNDGATVTEAKNALKTIYSISATVKSGNLDISKLKTNIDADYPVYTGGSGHAVLVNGYYYNDYTGTTSFTFMEPNSGTPYWSSTIPSSGEFSFKLGSTTYTQSSFFSVK